MPIFVKLPRLFPYFIRVEFFKKFLFQKIKFIYITGYFQNLISRFSLEYTRFRV